MKLRARDLAYALDLAIEHAEEAVRFNATHRSMGVPAADAVDVVVVNEWRSALRKLHEGKKVKVSYEDIQ